MPIVVVEVKESGRKGRFDPRPRALPTARGRLMFVGEGKKEKGR